MSAVRTFFTVILLLSVCTPAGAQTPDAELRAAEEALAAALIAKDEQAFQRWLAPDFLLRGEPDVDRGTWIANALKLCWGDQFNISDFKVASATPASAIVTFILATNRDPSTCEPAVVRSLLTDVWRRDAGTWRLALRHSGPAGSGVDVQFAKTDPPPPLFEGSAELSLVSTGGNSDTESLGLGSTLIWRPGRWTTHGQVSFVRSEAFDIETARSLVATVRQGRELSPRLDAFGRFEYLVDEFAGIDSRSTFDAGLGFKAVDTSVHQLRLDAGLGYSSESRIGAAELDSAIANLVGTYRWQIREPMALDNTALFTKVFERDGDWRFRNALALVAAMSRRFSLKLAHELKYVNLPVAGFEQTDRLLSAALVAKF